MLFSFFGEDAITPTGRTSKLQQRRAEIAQALNAMHDVQLSADATGVTEDHVNEIKDLAHKYSIAKAQYEYETRVEAIENLIDRARAAGNAAQADLFSKILVRFKATPVNIDAPPAPTIPELEGLSYLRSTGIRYRMLNGALRLSGFGSTAGEVDASARFPVVEIERHPDGFVKVARLLTGEDGSGNGTLNPGEFVVVPPGNGAHETGNHYLRMQLDGSLAFYKGAAEGPLLWSTPTWKNPGAKAVFQKDGNWVVYSSTGKQLWSSNTAGHPDSKLAVQSDTNLVIYTAQGPKSWSSIVGSGGFWDSTLGTVVKAIGTVAAVAIAPLAVPFIWTDPKTALKIDAAGTAAIAAVLGVGAIVNPVLTAGTSAVTGGSGSAAAAQAKAQADAAAAAAAINNETNRVKATNPAPGVQQMSMAVPAIAGAALLAYMIFSR